MAGQHGLVQLLQLGRELLDHVHGSMLSTGATNRDCQVTAVDLLVFGNPALQKSADVFEHGREPGLRVEKVGDFLVQASKAAQL